MAALAGWVMDMTPQGFKKFLTNQAEFGWQNQSGFYSDVHISKQQKQSVADVRPAVFLCARDASGAAFI
jgi:hypothetical protein